MLSTTRVGLRMLALRRARGPGAAPLRVAGNIYNSQRGLKLFPRFFARMLPLKQQHPVDQIENKEPKPSQQEYAHKHADTGIVNPVSLPGTGIGMFGFGSGGVDAIITTLIGISVVFLGGVAYIEWYKANVLNKIEKAFESGYDPALEWLSQSPHSTNEVDEDGIPILPQSSRHMKRDEQKIVDSIMEGKDRGHYHLFMGPKGSGKATMVLDAMKKVDADGVAICEAHPDLEVFRLRLGKALNYEYNEDSQTGLFQRRDPREAMNKLEKVAFRRAKRTGRPIVLVINNIHLFNNDDEGRLLLQQLQQRAESWAERSIGTMVFLSDDFWPYPVMRQIANRMHVHAVKDLGPDAAYRAFLKLRQDTLQNQSQEESESEQTLRDAAAASGGRLAYMSRLARSTERKMEDSIKRLKQGEKAWLLTNTGLIPDCDDDVMDEQKWSSCTWLLLREFVERWERKANDPENQGKPVEMPRISYYKCRQIMTRPDFINQLDHLNIISIDAKHKVRLDSMLTLEAARQVVSKEGFDELLQGVRDRVDEIESLHRTRELTFKDVESGDRIRVMVDKGGSRWKIF
ncbi:AAA domain protein [Rhizoctonia solani]|uniref:AAA domain protein n=2 Tax=Rhizoctonia solani TaxID=456999 RepID=A0A8H8P4E8_9AGAM|nr:AAA domain protein [Rhizoctonia solani]QRW25456.1 AAA domain protein [Rhizoctonia solani]